MYFVYNGVTIGGSYFSGTTCINKPTYTATRSGLSVSIDFLLTAASESSWWTAWTNYINTNTGLVSPGKKLVIYNGSTTVTFDPDPTSGDPAGIVLNPELSIIGAATDNQYGKICKIVFDINLTSVIANGCKDFAFDVEYTPIGQKLVTFYCEMPKINAGSETSALSNFKTNFKTMIEVILEEVLGGKVKYQLYQYKVDSKDPNAVTTGHKLNNLSIQATYKQVFMNQESGSLVSVVLKDPRLSIATEKYIDFAVEENLQSFLEGAYIRNRFRVEYQTEVIITSTKTGGEGNDFDLNKVNEVTDDFLKSVFQDTCLPRIEEILNTNNTGESGGKISLIDAEIKYNPSAAQISAILLYDTVKESDDTPIIYFQEEVMYEQISGFAYKYTDKENDSVYVDRPGRITYITVIAAGETFNDGVIAPKYKPLNAELLSLTKKTSAGASRCRKIQSGLPVYETTKTEVYTLKYVIAKKTSEDINVFNNNSGFDATLEDLFPGIGQILS